MISLNNRILIFFGLIVVASSAVSASKGQALVEDALARKLGGEEQLMRPDSSIRPFQVAGEPRRRGKLHGYPGETLTLRFEPYYRAVGLDGQKKELRVIQVLIDWGDGSPVERAPAGTLVQHKYGDKDNPQSKTFRAKMTFLVNESGGNAPELRFTESFTYNMWHTSETARKGEVQGSRDNPYYVEEAVDCSTYTVGRKCTDFVPADSEFRSYNIVWKEEKSGFGKRDYSQTPAGRPGYSCLILDLRNNRFQAEAVNGWGTYNGRKSTREHFPRGENPAHLWFADAKCGSSNWKSIDGTTSVVIDYTPSEEDIAEAISECAEDKASAANWLVRNTEVNAWLGWVAEVLEGGPNEDGEPPSSWVVDDANVLAWMKDNPEPVGDVPSYVKEEFESQRGERQAEASRVCERSLIIEELTGKEEGDEEPPSITVGGNYSAASNTFKMEYNNYFRKWRKGGNRTKGRHKHRLRSEFVLQAPLFDAGLLDQICADNNLSKIQLIDKGEVIKEVGCAENWRLEVPQQYLKMNAGKLTLNLDWRSTEYHAPDTKNIGAGGGVTDTNAELRWWDNYGKY